MLSPILATLWALWSGGAVFPCSAKLLFTENLKTDNGESWQFTCLDRWSEDSSLHYVPNGNTITTANCYDSPKPVMNQRVYNTKGKYLYSQQTTNTQIIWICNNDPKKFDSTFNVAAANVGTSPTFWALFSLSIGAGMYIGAAKSAVRNIEQIMDGGEKDD